MTFKTINALKSVQQVAGKHLLASLIKNRESGVLRKHDSVLLSRKQIITNRQVDNGGYYSYYRRLNLLNIKQISLSLYEIEFFSLFELNVATNFHCYCDSLCESYLSSFKNACALSRW